MINRKCSRCKEITGTMHGGKIKEEFLCEDCLQKELRAGNRIITSGTRKNLVSFYKDIKITSVIYLIVSIITAFLLEHLYKIQGLVEYLFNNRYSWCYDSGSIFQSVLVFCGIWVFILLVETVIKIMKNEVSEREKHMRVKISKGKIM